jgi:hypothetical protein
MKVKLLTWTRTPPEGMDGHPGHLYAVGLGGHYCVEPDGTLWWAHEPFTHKNFNDKTEAKSAAQIDHDDRVLGLIE